FGMSVLVEFCDFFGDYLSKEFFMQHINNKSKYRKNVAAIVKVGNKFLACYRAPHKVWQCVQGGVEESDVSLESALFREIKEELGVEQEFVKILAQSKYWRKYDFPERFQKKNALEKYVGQEQMWYLISVDKFETIDLTKSLGEFSEVKLVDEISELIKVYPSWKRDVFVDFCKELKLIAL
ncbi:MAG: NUDIX domain-containing protein, partial [Silvanigrellaceae bacterium]|nr:NUDIX domain-containing protein [Silvanigrellaceae bacterium]